MLAYTSLYICADWARKAGFADVPLCRCMPLNQGPVVEN